MFGGLIQIIGAHYYGDVYDVGIKCIVDGALMISYHDSGDYPKQREFILHCAN